MTRRPDGPSDTLRARVRGWILSAYRWLTGRLVPGRRHLLGGGRPNAVPPSWAVPAWYIDENNTSGTASDSNTGTSPSTALRTKAELISRWSTLNPVFSIGVTVTFVSLQSNQAVVPWLVNPAFLPGGSLTLVGATGLATVQPFGPAPLFATGLGATQTTSARQVVFTDGYAASADGGGGAFTWEAGSTAAVDGGTVFYGNGNTSAGTAGRFIRVVPSNTFFNVRHYGADPTGTNDCSTALANILAVAPRGSTIFFPGQGSVYKLLSPILITTSALRFVGESCGGIGGATLSFQFPAVATGIHGSVTSVANNTPTSESNINATFTLGTVATGAAANIAPGDTIVVSGAANYQNDSAFTVITGGSTTCTYYGWSNNYSTAAAFAGAGYIPVAGDANNGSLTWAVYHPAIKSYGAQAVIFENLTFDGTGTVGALFDVTFQGTSNVGNGNITSDNKWYNCLIKNGVYGVKIGDFSGWVAPATTIAWPTNCDLCTFDQCYIQACTFASIFIPSASGQSKNHQISKTFMQFSKYGINCRSGSYAEDACGYTLNGVADRYAQNAIDALTIRGSSSEGSARALVLGSGGFNGPYPCEIVGCRFDVLASQLISDGTYIVNNNIGGLAVRNNTFSAYDGVQGVAAISGTPQLTFSGSAHTIVRSTGSWVTDGFSTASSGAIVNGATNAANNGSIGVPMGVTATTLTFATGLVNEGPDVAGAVTVVQGQWGIWVRGGSTAGVNDRMVSVVIEGCTFPQLPPANIVVSYNQSVPVFWESHGNVVTTPTTATQVPNGILPAFNNQDQTHSPTFSLPSLSTPEATVVLANGTTNNLAISYSAAICTGPTGACTITGITAPPDASCKTLELVFDFNQNVTITNNDASSTAGNRILTPTGASVTLTAAGAFTTCRLRYSTTLGAWLLLSA
jgi:hypothetical protein